MHVKVSEISEHASTVEVGEQVRDLIAPALMRGEPVILDFEGVKWVSGPFFCGALVRLIETDSANKLADLLKIENITPHGRDAYDLELEYAIRRRDPRWAEAMGRAAEKLAARE